VVLKKSEKLRFLSLFFMVAVVGRRVEKIFFSDFFKTTLEMFSILEYIGQVEILAEKNYLGCFRQVRKFKKST
jgi:hypothetical protein